MKTMLNKMLAATAVVSTAFAPMATELVTVAASRTAAVAAVGAAAVVLPGAAYAQSGKRVCAGFFRADNGGQILGVAMEVYKWDVGSCIGFVSAWGLAATVPAALRNLARSYALGSMKNAGLHMMQTCESYTRDVGTWGNLCERMQDYRVYIQGRVGSQFVMTKL